MSKRLVNNKKQNDLDDFDINESLFYGLILTDEQKDYRNSIYSDDYDIIFCDSPAGSGKTTVAVATAKILIDQGKYDKLIYLVNPTQEDKQGYIPGGIQSKTMVYADPLYSALTKIREDPEKVIRQNLPIEEQKISNHKWWVDCISHTFIRGTNFNNSIVIADEMQNTYVDEACKIITRQCTDTKMICIGNQRQIDIYKNPERSGLGIYLEWFRDKSRCKICNLTKNFRMWTAQHADEITESDISRIIEKLSKDNK